LWNESYITKIIHNRSVLGEYQPHLKRDGKRSKISEPILDYFPRIVSDEDFYLAKSKVSDRLLKGGRNAPQAANLIRGLAKCAECGSLLRFKNKGSGETYLQCASSDLKSPICKSSAINYRSVENFIIETVLGPFWASFKSASLKSSATKNTNSDQITVIDAKIDQLKSSILTFADAMESGGKSHTLLARIRTKEAEIESLNLEKETLKTEEAKQKEIEIIRFSETMLLTPKLQPAIGGSLGHCDWPIPASRRVSGVKFIAPVSLSELVQS
jgi:hypothetical protein